MADQDAQRRRSATPTTLLAEGAAQVTTAFTESTANAASACCGRRQVLRGAAAAGLAVSTGSVLAACGGGEDAKSADGGVKAADVAVGSAVLYAADKTVVAQPTAGTFVAFDTTCTHAGCNANELSGTTLTCPCHGSEFDVTTGDVVKGPATTALRAKKVTDDNGTLTIT